MGNASNECETSILSDDSFWPDPKPVQALRSDQASGHLTDSHVWINDVSRMSSMQGTPVSRIFFPRCESDVLRILQMAYKAKKCIGIRGTKHSMGGHSIASQRGWEIDTKYLNFHQYQHMGYMDKLYGGRSVVRCGPGCQWSDIIRLLNFHGKSPRTMQSYCSFSVGGTLAVNAHGITTDFCFAESVLEFRLARINEEGVAEIVICRPPSPQSSSRRCSGSQSTSFRSSMSDAASLSSTETRNIGNELFGLALGGYGLFGVMTEIVLKVADNVQLTLDTLAFDSKEEEASCDNYADESELSVDTSNNSFVRVYDNCREGATSSHHGRHDDTSIGRVEIKLARLNILNPSKISLYLLRRTTDDHIKGAYNPPIMSELPVLPKKLSKSGQLLYKWALPLMKEQRYNAEERKGEALDWNDSLTRNEMLFESAVPLSRLYEPLVKNDDTFVLQEFFVPHHQFYDWIEKARPIFKDLEVEQHKNTQDIILLNTTIRFVERDDLTFLNYSRHAQGVFAFVLYYRIKRCEKVDKRLGQLHDRFVTITLALGGTFYLPYRRNYTPTMLMRGYPMINDFAKLKETYDPHMMFQNLWFEEYILPLCGLEYQALHSTFHAKHDIMELPLLINNDSVVSTLSREEFWAWLPRKDDTRLLRRSDSYRSLLRSKKLREEFRYLFLVKIFNIANPDEVMRVMTKASYDPRNKDDISIYREIYSHFNGRNKDVDMTSSLLKGWRAVKQIRAQKDELTRQTASILSKLGRLGDIHSYVCVGDHGKTIKDFVHEFDIKGRIWVVHDSDDIGKSGDELPSLGTVLERGSLTAVAHNELSYDYMSDSASKKLEVIPTNSVDLVTMNQGLHHIPLSRLYEFLIEIYRVLRPGSVFIIREHDLELPATQSSKYVGKTPIAMLDLAHSIFNAVTGVSIAEEETEIRAFRPVIEWRNIVEKIGFVDSMIYEVEEGDPTDDEMIAFVKPKRSDIYPRNTCLPICVEPVLLSKDLEIPAMNLINTFLGQVPKFITSNSHSILEALKTWLPVIQGKLKEGILSFQQELSKGAQNLSTPVQKLINTIDQKASISFDQTMEVTEGLLALLARSDTQETLNVKNITKMQELFLILPYLHQKVDLHRTECTVMEVQIVDFIREFIPSLLSLNQDKTCKKDDNSSHTEHSYKRSDRDDAKVTGEEVKKCFSNLSESIPGILDSEKVLVNSGFTLPQQLSLVTRFGGQDQESTFENLASYLDRKAWSEIKHHLKAVASRGDMPTKSRMLYEESKGEYHPWNHVLKSFFKSRHVQITQQALFGLTMMNLKELGILYKQAKKEMQEESLHVPLEKDFDISMVANLNTLNGSILSLDKQAPEVKSLKIKFERNHIDLWDVAEVLEAKFGYISVTSRLVDVTTSLQELHTLIHRKLANPHLQYDISARAKVGWLPIDEQWLIEVRNKGNRGKEVGDMMRKGALQVATLGLAGKNKLQIKYRRLGYPTSNEHIDGFKAISHEVESILASHEIINGNLHKEDGEYTWYKLSEWMQVEILDQFVKSLDHTPWYRFPFMSFLRIYFDVFMKSSIIVREKYGAFTAYGSMAFLTDLIPGIVMALFFGQLKLLAYPLELARPIDGDAGVDKSRALEQCIIHLPSLSRLDSRNLVNVLRDDVDERVLDAKALPHNFLVLHTPPFKSMGEILQKLSIRFPDATLLQISNQDSVQVRVCLDGESTDLESPQGHELRDKSMRKLCSVKGVKHMMQYQFPNTENSILSLTDDEKSSELRNKRPQHENILHLCFEVDCCTLLYFFRFCEDVPHCRIEQVYDFWN